MPLYLLHFDKPLGTTGRASARHYLGWVAGNREDVHRRVQQHFAGRSDVKIVEAFKAIGARGTLVYLWPGGDRGLERRLKLGGRLTDFCRLCATNRAARKVRQHPKGHPVWPQTNPILWPPRRDER